MSADFAEVRNILSVLAPKVEASKELLTGQEIGNALYGLKCMSVDYSEVRNILSVLVPKIEASKDLISGQGIGNALYGLQRMSADYAEVRNILSVLVPKIEASKEVLTGQGTGNALYGLQLMSTDYAEVRNILSVLVPKIEASKKLLTEQEIGNALYGFQCMSADYAEVRNILSVLVPKIEASKEVLTGQGIGNALYGLQCMDNNYNEVRMLLNALLPKLLISQDSMSGQDIGMSLCGIMNMQSKDGDELNQMQQLLVNAAANIVASSIEDGVMKSESHETFIDLLALYQFICFLLLDDNGISNSCKTTLETAQKMLLLLFNIENTTKKLIQNTFKNNAEKRLFKVVSELFEKKRCHLFSNVYHLGFECDILIRGEYGGYINIECDGVVHSAMKKQKFCKLRDEYFRRNKIFVLRLLVNDHLFGVSDEQLKQTIINMIRQLKDKV